MRLALSRTAIELQVASRLGDVFKLNNREAGEVLCTGISEIDAFVGGLPRGAISEVFGAASSGRTSFTLATLAHAIANEEVCALVDTNNAFDPTSAARAEINCERLLWIRCANNLEHAFKATDLLLHGGGFGLVTLDLGDIPPQSAKRIISSWWYRFRRTLESTPTALVVIAEESCVRSCASLALELKGESCVWSSNYEDQRSDSLNNKFTKGNTRALSPARSSLTAISPPAVIEIPPRSVPALLPHSNLLQGLSFQVDCHRPLYLNRRETEVFVKASH